MATNTPNLNLKKPAGTDYVRVGDFNANADILDAKIGNPAQLETAEKTSLVLAINEAKNQGQYPPYIDDTTKTWWAWNPATHQFEDTEEPARGDKGDPGVSVTVGTTTTGLPGTSASVVNVGTASDPVLEFTIPRGDAGTSEINSNTPTSLTGILVGDSGKVRQGVSGTDYAAPSHAAQHASGGSDPVTVGSTADLPVFTGEGGVLGTKSAAEARTALDAQQTLTAGGTLIPTPASGITVSFAAWFRYGRVVTVSVGFTIAGSVPAWTLLFTGIRSPIYSTYLFATSNDGVAYVLSASGVDLTSTTALPAGSYQISGCYISAS